MNESQGCVVDKAACDIVLSLFDLQTKGLHQSTDPYTYTIVSRSITRPVMLSAN